MYSSVQMIVYTVQNDNWVFDLTHRLTCDCYVATAATVNINMKTEPPTGHHC